MTTFTGNGIQWYKWQCCKSTIKLNMKGLKSRAYTLARPRILKELGLPPRTRDAKVLEAVERKLEQIAAQLKQGDITP